MLLGDLPIFKTLLQQTPSNPPAKRFGKKIALEQLEVVQLFHVSPTKNRESILLNGLIPREKLEGIIIYPPAIFVSTTYQEIAFDYVSHYDVDVWTFSLPKHLLMPDPFTDYANHYYITLPVPPYKLMLLETIL